MPEKIGLTLGKYAPLHKGHCFVFDTALAEVDRLIVLIYHSNVTQIPLSVRANWIRRLYPQIEVLECWDGPEGYSSERAFEIEQENYIIQRLNGQTITHFYSSEFYGDHVSKALHAIDRRVDESRQNVPVCATDIRSDAWAWRPFIPDVVYRDLIIKVVFVGAMSTGKTTLAAALADKYNTQWMPEYGREYWTKNQVDRRINLEDFDHIAAGHLEREEQAVLQANRYLFVDTNAITTAMYCLDYHQCVTPYLTAVAESNLRRYDLFFLCDDDIPYDDTWDRSGPQKRMVFQRQIVADLLERHIPYIILRGDLSQRIATVERILADFRPFSNFLGNRCLPDEPIDR